MAWMQALSQYPVFLTLCACSALQWLLHASGRTSAREAGPVSMVTGAAAVALLVQGGGALLGLAPVERFAALAALLLTSLAAIQTGVAVVFQWLLPVLRLRVPRIVQDITLAGVCLGAALFWIGEQGVDPSRLFTTSAILTAVIAFAMQDTLGNILGGVVLQLDNSLKIGDVVRVDDVSGTVVEVRWRYTAIETADRETVVVPNSWLMKNRFRVLRARPQEPLLVRRTLYFHVDPECAPTEVARVIDAAVADSGVATVSRRKLGSTVLMDVTAGYCRYALRYWLEDPDADIPTDSQLRMHVHAALQRAGMALGAPQEVHLQRDGVPRDAERDARRERWGAEAVAACQLFAGLGEAERASLVARLHYAPFVARSYMARQGEPAHHMYLIVRGRAQVSVRMDGAATPVATLGPGEYFGEMGLLTGEARSADVQALEDMQCLRLDKAGFAAALQQFPAMAEEVTRVLASRQFAQSELPRHAAERGPGSRSGELLERLKHFFGLAA